MKEKTKVDPSGTDSEYPPSRSVAVPIPVPGTDTVAPGIGSPFWSMTVPETVISIACTNSIVTDGPLGGDFSECAWAANEPSSAGDNPGKIISIPNPHTNPTDLR